MIKSSAAVSYLHQHQLNSGGFNSFSSPQLQPFLAQFTYETTFTSSLILGALNALPPHSPPLLAHIKSKVAQFLLTQKSPSWTWGYWAQHSAESKLFPLPDDLDDSSCAWAALYQSQPDLFTGKVMAQITQTLTSLETKPGGPYRTWVTSNTQHPHWSGVDLVVNSNIAYFLKLLQIELPSLTQLFEEAILRQDYSSPYYPTPYPVIYFLAKSYAGDSSSKIIDYLLSLQQPDQTWGSPLNTALAGTALLRLGHQPLALTQTSHQYLRQTQLSDGSWPAASFCCDPSISGQSYYAGSASLTTAFVLEYLALTAQAKTKLPLKTSQGADLKNQKINQQAWQSLRSSLAQLDPSFQPLIKTALLKLGKADQKHHIGSWTYRFTQSLSSEKLTKSDQLIPLNTANFWGWLAYSLYDDVLDHDADVSTLSLANIAHRQLVMIYNKIAPKNPQFLSLFTEIMNTIDLANFKEVTTRAEIKSQTLTWPQTLPDYSQLTTIAEKSLGHALGPVAVMMRLGYSRYDTPVQTWLEFMYHYLTARQLNDDAHDWEQDLQKGQLTPVVMKVLQTAKCTQKTVALDPKTISKLQKVFWHQVLPEIIRDIKTQLKAASQALKQNPIIKDPQFFQQLLDKLDASGDHTLQEQQQAVEFIQAYEEEKS